MTADLDAPVPNGPTRAEIQAQRRAVSAVAARADAPRRSRAPSDGRGSRANAVLAVVAVVLALAAAGLGVFAFVAHQDAQDTRDASRPLETRAARLRADLSASDVAIDDLSALFIAIRTQNDATAAAVAATNKAAMQYNNAQAGIADALGAEATDALTALGQATAAVKTAAAQAEAAITGLGAGDTTNG